MFWIVHFLSAYLSESLSNMLWPMTSACNHMLLNSSNVHAQSVPARYNLIVVRSTLNIRLRVPGRIRSSKIMYLIVLEIFRDIQATCSPLRIKKIGTGIADV